MIRRRTRAAFFSGLLLAGLLPYAAVRAGVAEELQESITSVAERAFPAVVVITNKQTAQARRPVYPEIPPQLRPFFGLPEFDNPPGQGQAQPEEMVPEPVGTGSGVIIRRDGYVVTNYHVVREHDALEVKLRDGRIFDSSRDKGVEVVGVDEDTDLAVLRIGGGKVKDLPTLPFADSEKVKVGQWAIAVGAPFQLDYSVNVGFVSQKGRYDMRMNTYENYIQTDAAINPGNSGGPLMNISGEVIGINNFIVTGGGMSRGSVGIGFSIASNLVRQVADQIIASGRVIRPWLGIAMQQLNSELKASLNVDSGVLVSEVMDGDPADQAGVEPGDVILKVNDREVRTPHDVQFAVLVYLPGDEIELTVVRKGERRNITVIARERGGKGEVVSSSGGQRGGGDLIDKLGLSLEATPDGVFVTGVEPGSPASRTQMQIRRGDKLLEVNYQPVKTIADVAKALAQTQNNVTILYMERRGSKFFVAVPLSQEN